MHRVLRLLTVVVALLATGCTSFSQKPYLERLQWGSAPEALGPHAEIILDALVAKRNGRCYRRLDGGPIVDGVSSRDTEYCFNSGALYSVKTHFDGDDLRGKWHQWLTEIYGRPAGQRNQLTWTSKDTSVSLRYITTRYYGAENTGTVTWTNQRYSPPFDSPACEPFDPNFQACMEREGLRIRAIDAR